MREEWVPEWRERQGQERVRVSAPGTYRSYALLRFRECDTIRADAQAVAYIRKVKITAKGTNRETEWGAEPLKLVVASVSIPAKGGDSKSRKKELKGS
jgi:hypothetical protein